MAFVFLDKRNILIAVLIVAVAFVLGIIIGHYGTKQSEPGKSGFEDQFSMESELIKEALKDVNSDRLRSFHKTLTKEPHIAGQRRDQELTKLIQKAWMDMGIDHVELAEFDFYLSWPNQVLTIY